MSILLSRLRQTPQSRNTLKKHHAFYVHISHIKIGRHLKSMQGEIRKTYKRVGRISI